MSVFLGDSPLLDRRIETYLREQNWYLTNMVDTSDWLLSHTPRIPFKPNWPICQPYKSLPSLWPILLTLYFFYFWLLGLKETRKACCERDVIGIMCKRGGRTCADRDAHVFFDGLHPTDIVNAWIAKKAYGSNFHSEVYPFNVSQLALL